MTRGTQYCWDAGQVGCKVRKDAGQEGCRIGQEKSRTGRIQDRRDAGQKGCRTFVIQDRCDT